jgi:hypothetical protein
MSFLYYMVIMGFQALLSNEAYNSMDWSKDSLAKRQSVTISEGKWQIFAFWDMTNPIESQKNHGFQIEHPLPLG